MCGIVGMAGPVKNDTVHKLFQLNNQRGRDAFGFYVPVEADTLSPYWYRTANNYADGSPWYMNVEKTLIANFRAEPTTEYIAGEPAEYDLQPYEVGDWVIVHNGTIANDKELCERYGFQSPTIIDSWVIAALCDRLGSLTKAVRQLVGSYAILAINKQIPDRVYFACNYRPLYLDYKSKDGARVLSSVQPSETAFLVPPYSAGYIENGHHYIDKGALYPDNELGDRALVVFSGGLDSTVAACALISAGYHVELLHFAYGARAQGPERNAVEAIAAKLNVPLHIVDTPIFTDVIKGSRLTNTKDTSTAPGEAGAEYAHEWVPARNLIMTSIALGIAEARGFNVLALGANLEEAGAYPDNEPEFLKQFNKIIPFAVADGTEIRIETPVGNLMKHEIVELGNEVNAPFELTWSCYNAQIVEGEQAISFEDVQTSTSVYSLTRYRHCGNCGPCYMRKKAFEINGLVDPVFGGKPA